MRQEGSYGNSHADTSVEAAANLNALNPDWLIEHELDASDKLGPR